MPHRDWGCQECGAPWKGAIPQWEVVSPDRWLLGPGALSSEFNSSPGIQVTFPTELHVLSRVTFP
jgi:hypothetical protein